MIIERNPIGKGLDAFRASFNRICDGAYLPCNSDALNQLGQEGKNGNGALLRALLTIMQASRSLYSLFYQRRKTFPLPAYCLPRPVVAPFEYISGFGSNMSTTMNEFWRSYSPKDMRHRGTAKSPLVPAVYAFLATLYTSKWHKHSLTGWGPAVLGKIRK